MPRSYLELKIILFPYSLDKVALLHMTVLTTTPGMQLYTANFLSPRTGKGGAQYQEGGAVCLETQFYPDAIHHANFPSPVLRAGSVYCETTILRFA